MNSGDNVGRGAIDFRELSPVFQTVRGFTVASTAAAVAVFGAAWDPRLVWMLLVLAALALGDSLRRRRMPQASPKPILLIEALIIVVTVLLIGGPTLVAAPVAYFLTAALLVLPIRRALLVIGFLTGCTVGVYLSSMSKTDPHAGLIAGLVTVLVFMGAMTVLLVSALRVNEHMRTRERVLLEEAQAANRAKTEMLTRVSHELRTPLSAVVGFSQILRDDSGFLTEGDRAEAIQSIAEESSDLSGLIDDLLTAARYEIGELTVRALRTDLRAQTSQVLEAWYGGPTVEIEGDASPAYADPARVRQIIRNLISNAHRYGGARIRVVLRDGEGFVGLEVRDNGGGIPSDLHDRVFGAFYRIPKEEIHPSSIGLGLAVSRDLARLMGGDLTYRYESGESIFRLQLPPAVGEPASTVVAMAGASEEDLTRAAPSVG